MQIFIIYLFIPYIYFIIGSIVDFNSKLYFSPFDDRPVYGGFGPHSVRQTSRVGLYTSKSTNKAAPFISANRQITATNTRLLNIGRRHTGSNNSPEEIRNASPLSMVKGPWIRKWVVYACPRA